MFSKQFVAVALCILPALAAPSPLIPIKRNKNPVPGRHIVTFKNDVGRSSIDSIISKISSQSKVTHKWDIIDGFAGSFSDADLELLRADPDVTSIAEEGYVYTQAIATQ